MKDLIEKLNEIQRKMKVQKLNQNPGAKFKSRSADDILEAVKPFLGTSFVLTINNELIDLSDGVYVKSVASLYDASGNSIDSVGFSKHPLKMMAMSEPQLTGTATSYANKQAMGNLFALDNNPDIDMRNQYAEECEKYADLIDNEKAFEVYMFTQSMEVEERSGLWKAYKAEYVGKGAIGATRAKIAGLNEKGRTEGLRALEAFNSEDESERTEAEAEYTSDQIRFINTLEDINNAS